MPAEDVMAIEELRRAAAEKAQAADLARAEAFAAELALADAEGRALPSPAASLLAEFGHWLAALALFRGVPGLADEVLPGEESVTLLDAITLARDESAAILGALPGGADGTTDAHARFALHPLLAERRALVARVLARDPGSAAAGAAAAMSED